jgi:hypothetical protein
MDTRKNEDDQKLNAIKKEREVPNHDWLKKWKEKQQAALRRGYWA